MDTNERLAYCYWNYLAVMKTIDRLKGKEILSDDDHVTIDIVADIKDQLE